MVMIWVVEGGPVSTRSILAWFGGWIAALSVANALYRDQHLYLWGALGLTSAIAMIIGVHRNRPRRLLPWYLLAGSLLAQALGDATLDVLVGYYHEEDPFIREEFRRRLAAEGVDFTMPDSAFQPPAAATVAAD